MKKIIGLVLVFFSVNGFCAWTQVVSSQGADVYVDFATKKKAEVIFEHGHCGTCKNQKME